MHRLALFAIVLFFLASLLLLVNQAPLIRAQHLEPAGIEGAIRPSRILTATGEIYLPMMFRPLEPGPHRVNVPHFDNDIIFQETAIFWFGQVDMSLNSADVRVGYNSQELRLRLASIDRLLWFDQTPSAPELTQWDAASFYIDLDGNAGEVPDSSSYRIVIQLSPSAQDSAYWRVYQGNGSGWDDVSGSVNFEIATGWRGDSRNNYIPDDGWVANLQIPFSSVGLSGPPAEGSIWGAAVILHDRDNADGSPPIPDQSWPQDMAANRPETWAQLRFGLPQFSPPQLPPAGTTVIRHGLNGANVPDGHVGGWTLCGGGLKFDGWGELNYAGQGPANIQNQSDVADWPCFSRYYITFPLDQVPAGKVIISATLTLFKQGNSGAPGEAEDSLIQVHTIVDEWDEATLTWNNSPYAQENVAQTWVPPVPPDGWPGTPFHWDLTRTVTQAYEDGTLLRLALYEADSAMHSGKYFNVSEHGEGWDEEGRPTLTVIWAEP